MIFRQLFETDSSTYTYLPACERSDPRETYALTPPHAVLHIGDPG